jgi:homoserine O-acetyltransferase/O-succinyltransferase
MGVHMTKKGHPIGIVETQYFTFAEPPGQLLLESGKTLGSVTLAYETYGHLNQDRTNAILVLHALSADAHAAGHQRGSKDVGWWDAMIGPGKAFDTDLYYVICSNVIGGCKGSTGPSSVHPESGKAYGLDFPLITIGDMVEAQRHLIDFLGIDQLLCVVGGSMGGMQALQWVASYPERVRSAIPIATALKNSPQQIAFNEVVRQSIMADPTWRDGNYYEYGQPEKGLAIARMLGHITFMSDQSMEEKFSRRLKTGNYNFKFGADFEVESYLRYRGDSFVKRFDANSYLYVTKALDYFDVSGGRLVAVNGCERLRFLVISFKSDWLYPPYQSQEIVKELKRRACDVTYCEIASTYGHDAFLVEVNEQTALIRPFLDKTFNGYEVVDYDI